MSRPCVRCRYPEHDHDADPYLTAGCPGYVRPAPLRLRAMLAVLGVFSRRRA